MSDDSIPEGFIWDTFREFLPLLPNQVLNILISPGGRGKLGRPLDFSEEDVPSLDFDDVPLYLIVLLALPLILPDLLRYVLGHVAPTILILEASQQDEAMKEKGETTFKQWPTFRNVQDAFRLIYRAQGLYTFIRAMFAGVVYFWMHTTVSGILDFFLFRHSLLEPLSHACASAILCGIHFRFTCATISAQRIPFLSLSKISGQNRWKTLAIPAFLYGLTQGMMKQLYDFVAMALIDSEAETHTAMRAVAEVLAVVIMFAFRFILLIPTHITLTLAEAKFLPAEIETVAPSRTKERGLKIGELFGDQKPSTGLKAFTGALSHFGTPMYLWLIELHLKKCFVQILLEFFFISILFVAALFLSMLL